MSDHVKNLLDEYYDKRPTSLSLQHLTKTGRGELLGKTYKTEAFMGRMGHRLATQRILAQFASYLRKELPIRLAHRIRDLDNAPGLQDMPTIREVKGIYLQSFLELLDTQPILNEKDEEDFAKRLEALYVKHAGVLVMVAKGAYELRKSIILENDLSANDPETILEHLEKLHCHTFLDRFYMSRIGIRVLAGQCKYLRYCLEVHIALYARGETFLAFISYIVAFTFFFSSVDLALRERPRQHYVGMINEQTSPSELITRASRDVMTLCRQKYGRTPLVQVTGRTDLTFPFMPSYLQYILLELLKNALRATAEHHVDAAELPPVTVIVADGTENEDVVIKIADEGGGIARSRMKLIWSYLYTTADPVLQEAIFFGKDLKNASVIAGLGFGLPISRSYCRYFGGDIDVMSMDGHGTDVFVYLKRLGDSQEPIPI